MVEPENSGRLQGRFVAGTSGNPAGRPRGSRNRTTLAAQALLDGEAEALTRVAINMALAGDMQALKVCLDRILPPRREPLDLNVHRTEFRVDLSEIADTEIAALESLMLRLVELDRDGGERPLGVE